MAFTYVLTTDIGKVRLLIGDTDAADYHFEDAELQAFIDLASGALYLAAAMALEAWAASITDSMTAEKIGDYSYSKKESANKMALATRYRMVDASTPAMAISSFDLTAGSGITAEGD